MASIHQGSASNMWQELIKADKTASDTSFFVFPGGRLSYKGEGEYLRNSIYKYVNQKNLDGAVCWISSLTGACTSRELNTTIEQFKKLPFVSIGQSVQGAPSVWFDAYGGMSAEVQHFIRVHKAKRIAFLRGPVNHQSAQERFTAYVDCLKDAGLGYDSKLVSSHFAWSEGKKAILELIEERGLVPGVDFDTLICASDYMLSGAAEVLIKRGVKIPETLRVGGFNDNDGIYVMSSTPTTVKMPIRSMVNMSIELLNTMLDGNEVVSDINLPSPLIIRRSCGCKDSLGGEANAKRYFPDLEHFISWFVQAQYLKGSEVIVSEFFTMLASLDGHYEPNKELDSTVEEFLWFLFEHECQVDFLLEAFNWFVTFCISTTELRKYIAQFIIPTLTFIGSRYKGRMDFEHQEQMVMLTTLKNELLQVRSFTSLAKLLNSHFKTLGYLESYLVLYKNNDSELITGYKGDEKFESISFSSSLLLPKNIETEPGLYAVEPLFVDQEELGYIVVRTQNHTAVEIEDIGAAISSAIKGIRLLDSANAAKAEAEKAERASSLFFTNISEGLKEPVSKMKEMLSFIPFAHQELYRSELMKAEQLLELALSEQGQLEMEQKLYPLSTLLQQFKAWRGFEELPAVMVDPERFYQAINNYLDNLKQLHLEYELFAEVHNVDARIVIRSSVGWSPRSLAVSTSFLLSERIITLFSGRVEYLDDMIIIHLPFYNIAGEKCQGEDGAILYIGEEEIPACLDNVIKVDDPSLIASFAIPQDVRAIALNCSDRSKDRAVVLQLINNSKQASILPIICFGVEEGALNLNNALSLSEQKIDNAICIIGAFPDILCGLSSFAKVLSFSNIDNLLSSDYLNSIGLLVLQESGYEQIKKARANSNLAQIPILILKNTFEEKEVDEICEIPNVIICNTGASDAEEFISRMVSIICGEPVLPPLTGALVKKAIAYLNKNARSQISRWQIAEAVNISEDYLTRIFHKEIGLSPSEYLNRYRIQLAIEELKLTGSTINEVAFNTGFQDQAYFCRVFKKIKGFSPGNIRKKR